jgi:hypothetical protein
MQLTTVRRVSITLARNRDAKDEKMEALPGARRALLAWPNSGSGSFVPTLVYFMLRITLSDASVFFVELRTVLRIASSFTLTPDTTGLCLCYYRQHCHI